MTDDTVDDNIIKFTKDRKREVRKSALPEGAKPDKGNGNPNKGGKKGRYKNVRNNPLTDKQEGYAQRLAAGEYYLDAFRATYDCSNMAPDTIQKFASRVKNQSKVKQRTLDLQRQIRRAVDAHCMGLPATTAHMPEPMAKAVKNELNLTADLIVTRQFLVKEQLKNVQLARETAQVSAAVAGINSIAKLEGFDQDSREKQVTGELERMSPEELKAYIREELSKTGGVTDLEPGQLVDMRAKREEV